MCISDRNNDGLARGATKLSNRHERESRGLLEIPEVDQNCRIKYRAARATQELSVCDRCDNPIIFPSRGRAKKRRENGKLPVLTVAVRLTELVIPATIHAKMSPN